MGRPVTIKILVEGGDSEKVVRRLTNAFEQTENAARRAAQASASVADKDVFARAAQTSRQFLNEMINSGGMRQYQEVLRQFSPQLRELQQHLKQGSFNQEDFNRRLSSMPPLLQKALRDVSTLGKGIQSFGEDAEKGSSGLQRMLIQADLAGRGIAFLTGKVADGWTEYKTFGKEISNVDTILADGSNVNKFRDGILQLPPALGSATELTKGLYQALSSGIKEQDALGFLAQSAKAAKAGVAEVKDTVDASTTIIASFNLEAKDATDIYDKMFETVKRGKVEMPQLAQSIGQVSAIASLAGVSLNELFAAVATSTLTNKPSVAIEGLRTALSNIIKPSEQAKDLAEQLGLEFSATALKSQGLAKFLENVSEKTGNSAEKLAVLFGDVQGFNIIASLAGSNAKQFAENLDAMGKASGNVDKAFQKQQQSLAVQFDNFTNRILKGLIGAFQSVEPAVRFILSALNLLLPVILAVTGAVVGLKLAWFLLNTQLFTTATAGIGNAIAALQLMWGALASVTAGTATLGTTLAVATGGLALIGAAVGLAIYYFSTMETAIDRANKVTLDSINANSQSLQNYRDLANEAQAVSQAQEGSTDRHEKLNAVIGKLEPATQAYIKALTDEKDQVKAVTEEIQGNLDVRKATLEATIRTTGEAILLANQQKAAETERVQSLNASIDTFNQMRQAIDAGKATAADFGRSSGDLKTDISLMSQSVLDANTNIENFTKSIGENEIKLIQAAKGLGLNNQQLQDFFRNLGYTDAQIQSLTIAYQNATNAANNTGKSVDNTTGAINDQTKAVFNLRQELGKLSGVYQEKIDVKVLDIVKAAKDKAEAAKMAREALKADAELKKAVEETKRIRENQKAAEDVFSPSERSGGARRTRTRLPNPAADFRRENRVITGNAEWDRFVYEFSAKYGVDPTLIFAQMSQESSFKRGAVSEKGASGLMQLMPATARRFGVKNIFDPKQNIEGGIKYMRFLLEKFEGNIALALAGYNAGEGAVMKYGNQIPPYKETQDYVKRISANYKRLKGGATGFEFGGNFSYERALEEQSDRLTEQAKRERATEALRMLRVGGVLPDSDVIQDIIRLRQDDAKKAGQVRPEGDAIRKELESQARSTGVGGGIEIEEQKSILETMRERFNLEEREGQYLLRKITIDKEVSVILEDQTLARKEAALQAEIDYKVLQQRNVAEEVTLALLEERNAQLQGIGDVERDLQVLRRQNADNQFVEQRRMLAAKREQYNLEKEISDLNDEIANGVINDALKIQAAYLRDILDLRNRETDAIIASNRAELELSRSMEISTNQIRARVLEHLAQQKTLSQSIGDGIIGVYDKLSAKIDENIEKMFSWAGAFSSLFTEPLKAIAKNRLTEITRNFLDKFFPGLGTEITKTNNPVARPIVDKIEESNKLLHQIALNTSGGRTGVGIPGGGGASGSNPYIYSATGDGSTRPRIVPGQPNGSGGFSWGNLKNFFSGKPGGIFGEQGFGNNVGTYGAIGAGAGFLGGMVGGRAGSFISNIGSGVAMGASIGSIIPGIGTAIGAAIGGGIGLLQSILGGDPKRKADKRENLPQLRQGFADSIKEFQQLIKDLDAAKINASDAETRATELRTAIQNGFNVSFQSKKYRRISQQEIKAQLAAIDKKPDGLAEQLKAAIIRRRDAEEFKNKFTATFADGVWMDKGFRNQYEGFKRRNGMMPGTWTGKDYIQALIAEKEMVLNPMQQARVIQVTGFDPFAYADIPNYQKTPEQQPPVRMARGGVVGSTALNVQPASSSSSGTFVIEELHLHVNSKIGVNETTAAEIVNVGIKTPDNQKAVVNSVRVHIDETGVTSDGVGRDLEKAKAKNK